MPQFGWDFDHWVIDGSVDHSNPISITMNSPHELTPVFSQEKYDLTIRVTGMGTTYPLPGINTYASNTQVSLSATPYEGWKFSRWVLNDYVMTDNSLELEIYTNMELDAIFEPLDNTTLPQTTLVVSTVGQGTVSKNPDLASYSLGSSVQLKATPSSGWVFKGWSGDESGSANPITVSMASNKLIIATFIQAPSTIVATTGSGGSITPSGSVSVNYGSSQTFTITANTGYHIDDVLVDGVTVGPVTKYTFNNVQSAHTISASFSNKYQITSSAGSGGSITPLGIAQVSQGGSQTYTMSPNAGYKVSSVFVDGVTVGAVTSYTFSKVQVAHTIFVSFTPLTGGTFTIYSHAYANGAISPSGSVTVPQGGSQTYTITPNSGYIISSIAVDGSSVKKDTTYTFSNIQADHNIYVSFKPGSAITFTITVSAGVGGTITPSTINVAQGGDQSFTISPNSGYIVSDVLIDGVSVGAVTSYAFSNVQATHTIAATFTPSQSYYVLTIQQPNGSGSITPDTGSYTYNQGATVQVTATPSLGWQVDHWVIDGSIIKSGNSISITMNSAHSLKVYFALIQFTLTLTLSGLGTVTSSPAGGLYEDGTIVTLTATPAEGYTFSRWSGDASGSSNPTTISMTSDKEVTAVFTQGTQTQYTLTVTKVGTGGGTVTLSPAGGTYTSGTVVTLTAIPATGSSFTGWSGDLTGSTNPVTLTMNGDKTVTATLTLDGGDPSNVKEIWKVGDTYYGTGVQSTTDFPDLWDRIHSTLVAGDTVHFAGDTEYVADRTIKLTKSGITLTGDLADGRPTAFIRSSSSTLSVFLFDCSGDNTVLYGIGLSGLGYDDNLDQFDPYQLVRFSDADNIVIEYCIIEHHHQYLLQLGNCDNFVVRNNVIRYGQNGIATNENTNHGGVIEYNEIYDCSQGPIKLRGCEGTVVRYNNIHLEYTYWRSFDHYRYPGTDGRGIQMHVSTGCQGIYFGLTDSMPCINCEVYGNTVTDASVHGTKNIIDAVDGKSRASPSGSQGCRVPNSVGTAGSHDNKFYDNVVDGAYYGVWIEDYQDLHNSNPSLLIVYDDNTFVNIVQNQCYITY